jgi:hypothetical protein
MSAQLLVARSFSTGINWNEKKYIKILWFFFFFYLDRRNRGGVTHDARDTSNESKEKYRDVVKILKCYFFITIKSSSRWNCECQ